MAINDTDKLLVNDGSKTETITFAQFKDGTVLNDSDKFLVNDGTKTETITWAEIEDELGPKGTVNTPTVLKPDDGAGSGDLRYLISDSIIDVEDVGGGQTKLTVSGDQDLDDLTGGVFMSDGEPAGGEYSQTGYKLVTTDIENVQVLAGFSYKLYAIPNSNGGADFPAATDLASIPEITTATYQEDVDFGNTPTSNTQAVYSFYELTTPGSMSVIRIGANAAKNASLAWSDDGKTWIGAIFEQPGGIGPNIPIQSEESHKYWCFWFTDSNHRQDLYTPDANFSTTVLAFPGAVSQNPDLRYFKAGDVVQGLSSYMWSPDGTVTNPENAVDGDESTYSITSVGATTVWETNLKNITSIEFKIYASSLNDTTTITLRDFDGNEQTQYVAAGSGDGTWTTIENPPSTLKRMTIVPNDNTQTWIYIVKVNNELLNFTDAAKVVSTGYPDTNTMVVDGGSWYADPGKGGDGSGTADSDTHVEYQTNGGKGTVISTNTTDNTILLSDTGDRDNRWIAENKAGTDFYVAGPTEVDSPLLTTNVWLQSSEFATTPEGVDGLKEIIWNLNGVDQPGTTLNPYQPTGLAFNTEYTVKVKHVANSIGESAWSASTTFTTGASRSLKEHYLSKILGLEEALKEAQAKPKRGRKKAD